MGWIDYWSSDSPIYVSARHKTLHYDGIARDTAALLAEIASGRPARILDFGCGDTTAAQRLAPGAGRLVLSDGALPVLDRLRVRYAAVPNIDVLAPAEIDALPSESFDVIIVNSVAQYLSRAELEALLARWRGLLTADGTLVMADIIPPDVSAATDALALLRFGWRGGFAGAAVAGLARTAVSDYRRLRAELGLSRYDEATMIALLDDAGFDACRRRSNLGHNQARMTLLARPRDAD